MQNSTRDAAGRTIRLSHLVADTDRDESPFGWSSPPQPPPARSGGKVAAAFRAQRALNAVRAQCADWTRPTTAVTWDSRLRDRSIAVAAGVLIDLIDYLTPELAHVQAPAAGQTTLEDRIATVLRETPRRDHYEPGARPRHDDTPEGHSYDMQCALCTGDIDALTAALMDAFTTSLATAGKDH